MTMKTSLVITGDSKGAVKAVDDLAGGIRQAGDTARSATAPIQQVNEAQRQLATSARQAADATGAGIAASNMAATAQRAAADASAAMSRQIAQAAKSHEQAATGSAAYKAAMQNLSFQIQDVGAQLSTVSGPEGLMRIFAQQGGQIFSALGAISQAGGGAAASVREMGDASDDAGVDAAGLGESMVGVAEKVENTGTKLGAVAGFLAGPWGAALLVAASVAGPFVAKMFESSDAADDAANSIGDMVDALKKQALEAQVSDRAQAAYQNTLEGVTEAVREQTKALDKAADAERTAAEQANIAAKSAEAKALSIRKATAATLADALAQQQAFNASQFANTDARMTAGVKRERDEQVQFLQKQLDDANSAVALAQVALNKTRVDLAAEQAKTAVDPIRGITKNYDDQIKALKDRQREEAALGKVIGDETKKRIQALEAAKAAAIALKQEEMRASNRKPEKVSLGDQLQREQAASMLAYAQRYTGRSENNAGDRGVLQDLFKQANMNVDPKITAWCAAFVNSVLAANGLQGTMTPKGTPHLTARSFLNYGQATDAPNKGDIVVSRRGRNEAQGHVGFYQGTDAKGNIRVLGGNTSDRVGTMTIARKDVLGFRQAPTAADAYKEAEKAAQDALKEFQKDLEQVTSQYLPATAEAKKYADELARIDRLAKAYDASKADSGLSPDEAAAARKALASAHEKRLQEIALTPEAKAAQDAQKAIDGVVASLGAELAARQALDPVTRAMAKHQDELNKLSGDARVKKEAELRAGYAQVEAYRAIEEATKDAAQAQRHFQDLALDAFDAIAIGGEKAGDVIDRLAQTIASAALEASLFGTGPLSALMKGAGTPARGMASGHGVTAAGVASQATADLLGKSVGKSVGDKLDNLLGGKSGKGQLLQGAGFGYTAANIMGGNGIGGALGGALGGRAATEILGKMGGIAGPLGSIAGGLLGGIVGKMFQSKAQPGGATVSASGGEAGVTGSVGKDKAAIQAGSGLGGQVASTINQIVNQLGGELGSFSVQIGKYKDDLRVNVNGRALGGVKGSGATGFGQDEQAAVNYAVVQAIQQGAVTGLSEKVTAAIRAATNVDKALSEALKVQQLELTLGGIGAQIDKAFADLERQAKDRMRIAQTYGFDVVAIEKKNAEDRVKLVEQLTKQQVGSLQALIKDMESGSLAEGTAMDRIAKLNEEIATAKADFDAGKEGAGDVLADLYQRRLAASKEAYGTTSGYAADRAATMDEARRAIAQVNARIATAQTGQDNSKSSDPALKTTNATLDEIADQNARVAATLARTNELLEAVARNTGQSGFSLDLRTLARS